VDTLFGFRYPCVILDPGWDG